jgi:hypothetical protein
MVTGVLFWERRTMRNVMGLAAVALGWGVGLVGSRVAVADSLVAGPFVDPYRAGYSVYVTSPDNWLGSEAFAQGLGGNLITIASADENAWVVSSLLVTFGGGPDLSAVPVWIGYYDPTPNDGGGPGSQHQADFVWADGSASAYVNWQSGEPNNANNAEYFTAINWHYAQGNPSALGTWNDTPLGGTVGYGGNTDGLGGGSGGYYGIVAIPNSVPEPTGVVGWLAGLPLLGRRRGR